MDRGMTCVIMTRLIDSPKLTFMVVTGQTGNS